MVQTDLEPSNWKPMASIGAGCREIRSALMQEVVACIDKAGMTQAQAARQFGVTQPRIFDVTRGKIDLFGIDRRRNRSSIGTVKAISPQRGE